MGLFAIQLLQLPLVVIVGAIEQGIGAGQRCLLPTVEGICPENTDDGCSSVYYRRYIALPGCFDDFSRGQRRPCPIRVIIMPVILRNLNQAERLRRGFDCQNCGGHHADGSDTGQNGRGRLSQSAPGFLMQFGFHVGFLLSKI